MTSLQHTTTAQGGWTVNLSQTLNLSSNKHQHYVVIGHLAHVVHDILRMIDACDLMRVESEEQDLYTKTTMYNM